MRFTREAAATSSDNEMVKRLTQQRPVPAIFDQDIPETLRRRADPLRFLDRVLQFDVGREVEVFDRVFVV